MFQRFMLLRKEAMKCFLLIGAFIIFVPVVSFGNPGKTVSNSQLADQVAKLNLGLNDYIIGTTLSDNQKKIANKTSVAKSYAGTYKFQDNDVYIVVSKKTDMILAVYQRKENGGQEDMKKMVGRLMLDFGEPTTMAHDQIIYWAYNSGGKISEELYNSAKQSGKLAILATVKFKSNITSLDGVSADKEKATLYTIITSEPLVQRFMEKS